MNFKFKYLIMPLALTLGACSDNVLDDSNNVVTEPGEVEYSYLSVNLVPATDAGTRADDGDFSVGSKLEHKVNSIRFYFFDNELKAVKVKANGATFYDVTADQITNGYDEKTEGENVYLESNVNAVIVIESPKGDDKPYYMAAVVNPTANVPELSEGEHVSLLQTDAKAIKDYSNKDGFIMSSTVYKGKQDLYDATVEGKTKKATEDSEIVAQLVHHKICPTRMEALEYPATLYVERVMGKVSSELALTKVDGVTDDIEKELTDSDGKQYKIYKLANSKIGYDWSTNEVDDPIEDIYVRFLGWNVTATRKYSRLIKKIDDTGWPNTPNTFDGWTREWNDESNHRSYWAINPASTSIEADYKFYDFPSTYDNDFGGGNAAYLQENAGKANDGLDHDLMYSKLIVGAQLVDSEGKPLTLVKWRGNIYNCGDDKSASKVLDAMATDTKIYIYDTDKSTWRSINHEDVEFVTVVYKEADEAYTDEALPRYYVSIGLKNKDAQYALLISKNGNDITLDCNGATDPTKGDGYAFDAEKIQEALASLGKIKKWTEGSTYYWVDIRHFGSQLPSKDVDGNQQFDEEGNLMTEDGTGEFGVVRNHWYQYKFTSLAGMGVPVCNPDEIIYPEIPQDPPEMYLGAEVRILSWRKIKQGNIELGK